MWDNICRANNYYSCLNSLKYKGVKSRMHLPSDALKVSEDLLRQKVFSNLSKAIIK